ncbi:hypothetical protein D9758_005047 [Tetrapyrgos nigripes]|uniref:Uncharacterized protein n=1 Tax=Tetrapyrgos nigripes TaxID=182062 RepID=A0A8H5GWD0_9AGAR|nr:hypothetical protein D9758_005047 [Tetrapyrgos nigripes]
MALVQQVYSRPSVSNQITPSLPSLHFTTTDGVHYVRRLHGRERLSAAQMQHCAGYGQIIAIGDLELKASLTKEEFEPYARSAWMSLRHKTPWTALRTAPLECGEPNAYTFTYEKPTSGDLSLVKKWADETIFWRTESVNFAEGQQVLKETYWKPADGRYGLELHLVKNREHDRWIIMISGPHWLTDGRGMFPVIDQYYRCLQAALDGSAPTWSALPWGEEVTRLPPSAIEIIPNTGDVVAKPPPPSTLFTRPAVERIPGRPESIDARVALSKEQTKAFNFACKRHRVTATVAINSILILAELESLLRLAKEKSPEQYAQLVSQYESAEGFPLLGNIVALREFLSPYWASLTGNTGTAGIVNLGFPTYHDMAAVRKCMQLGPDGTFIKNLGPQTFWKGLCANTQKLLKEGAKATPHMYHVSANMGEDTARTILQAVIGPAGVVPSSLGNLERLDWFTPFRPSVAWQTPNTAFAVHDWHFGVRVADTPSYVVHSWDYDGELTINIQGASNYHTEKSWNTFASVLRDTIEQLLSVKAVL